MKSLIFLFFTTLICLSIGEVVQDEETKSNLPARLLVEKRVLNEYLVENQNINIKYSIYNVGGNVAQNIELNDNNLSGAYFDKLNSTDSFKVSSLAPNDRIARVLVYKPKIGTYGRVNFTAAEIVYQTQDSNTILRTQSSEPGYAYILSNDEYHKRFSLQLVQWGAFILLSSVSLLFPFMLYSKSKNKYESIKKSK